MAFTIDLSRRASCDIEGAFDYIRARAADIFVPAPLNAVRWRKGLEDRIQSLKQNPEAFGFAPENKDAKVEIRQRLFGKYRILYTVRGDVIFILAIRHGARAFLAPEDVDTVE